MKKILVATACLLLMSGCTSNEDTIKLSADNFGSIEYHPTEEFRTETYDSYGNFTGYEYPDDDYSYSFLFTHYNKDEFEFAAYANHGYDEISEGLYTKEKYQELLDMASRSNLRDECHFDDNGKEVCESTYGKVSIRVADKNYICDFSSEIKAKFESMIDD